MSPPSCEFKLRMCSLKNNAPYVPKTCETHPEVETHQDSACFPTKNNLYMRVSKARAEKLWGFLIKAWKKSSNTYSILQQFTYTEANIKQLPTKNCSPLAGIPIKEKNFRLRTQRAQEKAQRVSQKLEKNALKRTQNVKNMLGNRHTTTSLEKLLVVGAPPIQKRIPVCERRTREQKNFRIFISNARE